jgi:ABC-type glycerol-3-phosphate transport system substrate-binding protein
MRRRQLLQAVLSSGVATGGAVGVLPSAAAEPLCRKAGLQARLELVANSFPVMQHLAKVATACNGGGLQVNVKLTSRVNHEVETAFASAGKSAFDAAVVSAGVFSDLYARSQLYPLTDLVRKYGARYQLEERMLVRMDGEVMAIAFMQNTQNLFYRRDLLQRHGIAVPTTYDQMLQAAALLRAREPGIANPIAQTFAQGWDLATEFTNLLASMGGRFFVPGSAEPAFHSPEGVATVGLMRSLLPYMSPNALASNSDDVMNQLQQGRAAMGVLWASRASRMDDPSASRVAGLIDFAAAPAARPGGGSAAHLWWDGVVLPRNGRAQREATFQVLMEMLSADAVAAGNDLTIWVRSNYKPGRTGVGVERAQAGGARVWPAEPFFTLAHAQVGKVLADALKGVRDPAQALAGAAASYRLAAIEKGYIREGRA